MKAEVKLRQRTDRREGCRKKELNWGEKCTKTHLVQKNAMMTSKILYINLKE